MSTFVAFVLGLLIGWVIEWVIDWIYWRRRSSAWLKQENELRERVKTAEARSADLERQLAVQKASLASAEDELRAAKAQTVLSNPVDISDAQPAPVRTMPVVHDDLVVIKGIGPVIAGKLNQVGIYSFEDLAAMTPERLRELVGDVISRLADEESIIEQAKQLAAKKSRGG